MVFTARRGLGGWRHGCPFGCWMRAGSVRLRLLWTSCACRCSVVLPCGRYRLTRRLLGVFHVHSAVLSLVHKMPAFSTIKSSSAQLSQCPSSSALFNTITTSSSLQRRGDCFPWTVEHAACLPILVDTCCTRASHASAQKLQRLSAMMACHAR